MRLNRGWMAEAEAQSPDYFQSFLADFSYLSHSRGSEEDLH